MKAFVALKRVVDSSIVVRAKLDASGVETSNMKMSINPFDEVALEEAIQLKESGIISEIIVASICSKAGEDILRNALAMGADRALHVQTELELSSLAIAKILRELVLREQVSLILLGKQAIDDDANQCAQMLAGLLSYPQATNASKLEIIDECAIVTREIDGGQQQVKLTLPAVISADLTLNEPRYIKLPNILAARKKPLETISLTSLSLKLDSNIDLIRVDEAPSREAGIKLTNVDELISKLKQLKLV